MTTSADTAASELLPCPFCGASASAPENIRPGKTPLWQISCAVFCSQIRRGTKGDVVRDWNRRSTAPTTGSAPIAWRITIQNGGYSGVTESEEHACVARRLGDTVEPLGVISDAAPPANAPVASVLTDADIARIGLRFGIGNVNAKPVGTRETIGFGRALLAASVGGDRAVALDEKARNDRIEDERFYRERDDARHGRLK